MRSANDIVAATSSREVSPVEVVGSCLAELERRDARVHAFAHVAAERALADAAELERRYDDARALPLYGVPIGVKDLHEVAGMRTTYGSIAYRDHVPDADCAAVARLRAAGAVIVGKTNTPAFGMLGETRNRLGPDTTNPHDDTKMAGGSSGGSAAAVGAGIVPLATGTDSAGSVTSPAGFCGVVGLKPTHGRVPCVPVPDDSLLFFDSGPLAANVADAALMLDVMSGHDERDPVSLREPPTRLAAELPDEHPVRGLRVAFTPDLGHFAADAAIRSACAAAVERLAGAGAHTEEACPSVEDPFGIYMPLYVTDVRRALGATLAEWPDDLFPESVLELQAYPPCSAEEYVGVRTRLTSFQAAMAGFFARFDVLCMPATAVAAFACGAPPSTIDGQAVLAGWTSFMPFQVAWNMTGQPTGGFPCGSTDEGLPIGLLAVGRPGRELDVVRVGRALELAGVPLP